MRLLFAPIGILYRLAARLVYLTLLALLGLPFAAAKWLLMGTRGSRERRKIIRQTKRSAHLSK